VNFSQHALSSIHKIFFLCPLKYIIPIFLSVTSFFFYIMSPYFSLLLIYDGREHTNTAVFSLSILRDGWVWISSCLKPTPNNHIRISSLVSLIEYWKLERGTVIYLWVRNRISLLYSERSCVCYHHRKHFWIASR
jgi:hypothetical protein